MNRHTEHIAAIHGNTAHIRHCDYYGTPLSSGSLIGGIRVSTETLVALA